MCYYETIVFDVEEENLIHVVLFILNTLFVDVSERQRRHQTFLVGCAKFNFCV